MSMTPTTRTTLRTLLPAAVVAVLVGPAAAQRRGAAPEPPPPPPPSDGLTDEDRGIRDAAELLAAEASRAIEQWLTTKAITEERLFSRLYFPIPKTDPTKYGSPYDALADRHLVALEDKALNHAPTIEQYAIVTDSNGYVPAHNTRFTQPLTGIPDKDYTNNRTKRLLGDPASLRAARSKARYLLQRTTLETGDVIYDLSVPIMVRGKHWGCARIGYRRAE
jgi:methyl-accepting chemotaxis protein